MISLGMMGLIGGKRIFNGSVVGFVEGFSLLVK